MICSQGHPIVAWKKDVKLTYAEEIGAERKDPEIVEIVEPDQEQTYEEQQSDVEG